LAVASYAVKIIILKFISIIFGLIIIAAPSLSVEEVVTISGSTAMLPLVAAAADAFNDLQKEYFVTVTGGGTQPGIIDIAERKVDIAMASRELTDEEKISLGKNSKSTQLDMVI
jgi:ABC-type phosphate transport system substrate-binding protein